MLLVDLPGHRRSALPPGRLTVEAMAARVEALLYELREERVHVVGISLGACAGLALTLRAPARVRSLTLVNGFAQLRPPDAAGALRMAVRLVLLATAPMTAVRAESQIEFQNVVRMTGSPSAVRLSNVNAPSPSNRPVSTASTVGNPRKSRT